MFDDLESVIGYQEATDFTYMVEDFKSLHGFAMFQPMYKSLLKMKTKKTNKLQDRYKRQNY